jgi:hypothetical protein
MLKHNQKLALNSFNDFKTISYRFPINNTNSNFNITNLSNTLDYYILYPKGRRGYLWFTYYKKEMLCLLIFINGKNINIGLFKCETAAHLAYVKYSNKNKLTNKYI